MPHPLTLHSAPQRDDLRRRQGRLPSGSRATTGHGPLSGEQDGATRDEGNYRRRQLYFGHKP